MSTSLVSEVRSNIAQSCLANKRQKQGCSVKLAGAPQPYILIDMDCPKLSVNPGDSKNDYVFISDHNSWVIPLELKSGSLDASEVLKQLQAGSQFAEKAIPKSIKVNFRPVAVVGGKIHSSELRTLRLKGSEVRFRGRPVRVEVLKCGRPLIEALKALDGKTA